MINLRKDPQYKQAVQSVLARQSEFGGVGPGLGKVARQRASELASYALGSQRHATTMDLGKKRLGLAKEELSMRDRIYGEKKQFAKEQMDFARSQGRAATALAVGGLGVTTLASLRDIQRTDELIAALGDMEMQAKNAGDAKMLNQARFLRIVYS